MIELKDTKLHDVYVKAKTKHTKYYNLFAFMIFSTIASIVLLLLFSFIGLFYDGVIIEKLITSSIAVMLSSIIIAMILGIYLQDKTIYEYKTNNEYYLLEEYGRSMIRKFSYDFGQSSYLTIESYIGPDYFYTIPYKKELLDDIVSQHENPEEFI